eukprot:g15441.t1
MGLSTRTLALLHDRLLFIWLQQNLHQDNGLTQVSAILQQESSTKQQAEVRCGTNAKTPHPNMLPFAHFDGEKNVVCYDRNLKFDPDAKCTALSSGAAPDHGWWMCFAAPGTESLDQNAYDDPNSPTGHSTSMSPPQFFGSADRSQTDATTAPASGPNHRAWYQSCCRPDQHHVLHERALIEEERLRNVKTYLDGLTGTHAEPDINALLRGDVDVHGKSISGEATDYHVLGDMAGYPALADSPPWPEDTPAMPITKFLNSFLSGIANDYYLGTEKGYGDALQRLLDGAIYERRQIIKTLYTLDDENYKSVSIWKTPDYPVTTYKNPEDDDLKTMLKHKGKKTGAVATTVYLPAQLPVTVKQDEYVLKGVLNRETKKPMVVPEGAYLAEDIMTKKVEAAESFLQGNSGNEYSGPAEFAPQSATQTEVGAALRGSRGLF